MAQLSGKKISKITVGVILIVFVLLVVAFFSTFTNGFTSDFKTFYVQYGNMIITNEVTSFAFAYGEPISFKVGYSLGAFGGDNGFNVDVYANATEETDFEYTVGGQTFRFVALRDPLTKCFEFEKTDEGFTIVFDQDLPEILREYYLDQEVEGVPTATDVELDYLKILVSTPDGSVQIPISFHFFGLLDVSLSDEEILF